MIRQIEGIGFYIGNILVAYYGLMIAAGILAAAAVGWYQTKRFGRSFDDFILIAAVSGLCGIVGAKLLYLLVSLDNIDFARLKELTYLNSLLSGGFVFYGGLIGGIGGLLLCRRLFRLPVMDYLQILIPCLPVVHGFGRIGCRLVGCCYGRPYSGTGAVTYLHSHFAPNNLPLFPVQTVEALFNFAVAILLLLYINRLAGKHAVEIYLICYALMRFILEFLRFDSAERGILAGLSTSQYISIAILAGVGIYLNRRIRLRKGPLH